MINKLRSSNTNIDFAKFTRNLGKFKQGQIVIGRILGFFDGKAVGVFNGYPLIAETKVPLKPGQFIKAKVEGKQKDKIVLKLLDFKEDDRKSYFKLQVKEFLVKNGVKPANVLGKKAAEILVKNGIYIEKKAFLSIIKKMELFDITGLKEEDIESLVLNLLFLNQYSIPLFKFIKKYILKFRFKTLGHILEQELKHEIFTNKHYFSKLFSIFNMENLNKEKFLKILKIFNLPSDRKLEFNVLEKDMRNLTVKANIKDLILFFQIFNCYRKEKTLFLPLFFQGKEFAFFTLRIKEEEHPEKGRKKSYPVVDFTLNLQKTGPMRVNIVKFEQNLNITFMVQNQYIMDFILRNKFDLLDKFKNASLNVFILKPSEILFNDTVLDLNLNVVI